MKLLSAKCLLNVSLHLGTKSSHSSRTNREKVEAQPTDAAIVTNYDDDDDDNQSVDLAVLLSGESSGEPNTEVHHDDLQDDQGNEPADPRPALRRETRSHRPVRRAPTRHSSCRALAFHGLRDTEDGPPRRAVVRHSSCRALPNMEETEARRQSLTRHPSARALTSRRGSAGASVGSSRLALVRRTSSRTLARCHASSGSLSASSFHDRSRASNHGTRRAAPARSASNDTLASVDSSIQTIPSSDDEGEEARIAKYGYETMSGLEYGSAAEPRPPRRQPSIRPSQARHPVRKPEDGHGPSSRPLGTPRLDAVDVQVEPTSKKEEPSRRSHRSSRARRSTPTVLKKQCPPARLRRASSDSDSQTCGSTSTEGTSPSGSNRSGGLDSLGRSSIHQSMTDVLSGLDELDSRLLGSSIHTTKSDPRGCS
jgi:hypothetical protein